MEGFITHRYILVLWGESEALGRVSISHKNMSVSMPDHHHTAHLPQNNMVKKYQKAWNNLQLMIVLNIVVSPLVFSPSALQAGETLLSSNVIELEKSNSEEEQHASGELSAGLHACRTDQYPIYRQILIYMLSKHVFQFDMTSITYRISQIKYQTYKISQILGKGSYLEPLQVSDGRTALSRYGWTTAGPCHQTDNSQIDCKRASDNSEQQGRSQRGHWAWLIQCYSVDPYIYQTLVPNFDIPVPSYTHSYSICGCCLNLSETRMWKIHIKLPENWSFIAYNDNKGHLFVQDLYSFLVQCFFQMTLIRLRTLSLIYSSYISLPWSL